MKRITSIIFVLSGLLILPLYSQNDAIDTQYSFTDTLYENIRLFNSDELFEISLRFNITYYKRKKPDEEYLDAILTYHTSEKDSINKAIKVMARGVTRLAICDFPPLLLNFKMTDPIEGEFSRINKLKMVTQCKAGNEIYILKEYLIYKLYNVLTDNSYNVRLLRVNYINTFKQSKPIREFAFAIEPKEALANRTNSVEVKSANLTQKNVKPEMMDRVAIFNYMIGNTDWAVRDQHNVTILAQPGSEIPDLGMIVPYDFDYSGLVNTNYSVPSEGLDIPSVLDRFYLGPCRSEEVFLNALNEFANKKEEFYKIIKEFPYLDEKSKKNMINYLNGFFNEFDENNSIVDNLLKNCKYLNPS
jgi:hypothetical protein